MGNPADQWWFLRGAQSALFFYASCGPCINARYNRKRKKEAMQSRKEKEAMRIERPDDYMQPAPFEINPHWNEEIMLGPGPPPRRQRNRTRDSKESRGGATTADGSITSSTTDFSKLGDMSGASKSGPLEPGMNGWNIKRYHRADEEFIESVEEEGALHSMYGTSRNGIALDKSGASIRRPETSYSAMRAPQINEHHPPVVTLLPANAQATQWMRAPPPSAAFMSGKKGVTTLSRGSSRASRNTNPPETHAYTLRWPGTRDFDHRDLTASDSEMYQLPTSRGNMSMRYMHAQYSSDTDAVDYVVTGRHRSKRSQHPFNNRRPDSYASSSTDSGFDSDESETPTHITKPRAALNSDTRRSRLPDFSSCQQQQQQPLPSAPREISLNSPAIIASRDSEHRPPHRKSAARPEGTTSGGRSISPTLPPQDSLEALDSSRGKFVMPTNRSMHRKSALPSSVSRRLDEQDYNDDHDDDDSIEDQSRQARNSSTHWMNYRKLELGPAIALHSSRQTAANDLGQRWSAEY